MANKTSNIKKFYDIIKEINDFIYLRDRLSKIRASADITYCDVLNSLCAIDPSEHSIPLPSPERMILARQLALLITPKNNIFNEGCKGRWQRYWLRCCLRDECNYFFALFKECGINREEDVVAILEQNYLWDIINSEEGKNYYKKTVAEWFLKRYNKKKANSVLKTIKSIKWYDKIRIWYPRLVVAILIGFLPVITQKDMWLMVINLPKILVILGSVFLFALSYFYLVYECNKVINDIAEAMKRAIAPSLWGLLVSLVFSFVICLVMGPAMLHDKIRYNFTLLELVRFFLKDIICFAFSALFIGIFIQLLWEEKTVTEPL